MGRMGKKVQRISSIIGMYKLRQGEVKNSIENGEAKELICTTHGPELRVEGLLQGIGVPDGEGQ